MTAPARRRPQVGRPFDCLEVIQIKYDSRRAQGGTEPIHFPDRIGLRARWIANGAAVLATWDREFPCHLVALYGLPDGYSPPNEGETP